MEKAAPVGAERRKYKRISVLWKAVYQTASGLEGEAWVRDLSVNGAHVRTNEADKSLNATLDLDSNLVAGERLTLQILDAISLEAEVMWSVEESAGLCFLQDVETLASILAGVLPPEALMPSGD